MSNLFVPGRKTLSSRPDEELIDGTMIAMAHQIFVSREELSRVYADLMDARDFNVKGQGALSYSHIQKALERLDTTIELLDS